MRAKLDFDGAETFDQETMKLACSLSMNGVDEVQFFYPFNVE